MKTSPEKLAYIKAWCAKNKAHVAQKAKERREANKDAIREQKKKWYAANAERVKAKVRQSNVENKDKISERRAKKYQAEADKIRAKAAEYRRANPQKLKERMAEYKRADPQRFKEYSKLGSQTRRAREKNAVGKLSAGLFSRLMVLQKGLCACCRDDLNAATPHLDHIIPLAAGGTNQDENIQLLCKPCNLSKGKKDPVTFMQERGFLC